MISHIESMSHLIFLIIIKISSVLTTQEEDGCSRRNKCVDKCLTFIQLLYQLFRCARSFFVSTEDISS